MTDDHIDSSPQFEQGLSPAQKLDQRWLRLRPDEQRLATMALEALRSGEFDSQRSWGQFADAAIELLPALEAGALSVEELHDLAVVASRRADFR